MKLHRYYAVLKENSSYKKRVTCVSVGMFNGFAVTEYSGVYVNKSVPHKNAKSCAQNYIRTNPAVLEKVGQMVQNKALHHVYHEIIEENSFEAPTDVKQVRNKKYNMVKNETTKLI